VAHYSQIPTHGADLYRLFLEGAGAACREAGCDLVYSIYRDDARPDYLRLFFQRKIAGMIIFIPDLRSVNFYGIATNRVVYGERPTGGRVS
jgi:DNA-binding LacI/PurR family transcriptional regulator